MWDDARQLNAVAAVLTGCAVVALLVGTLSWLARRPAFAIREVVVTTPLQRASAVHLEATIRSDVAGTFFTTRLDRAREALTRLPWVRSVALRRQWPDRLEIAVEEHVPLARWNRVALVNTFGEVFDASCKDELPSFGGPEGSSAEVVSRFRAWGRVLAQVRLEVRGLETSPRGGWRVEVASGAGPLGLDLGRDDPDARLARFVTLYPRTIAALERAGTRVEHVDLRYRNGFAARIPGFKERTVKPGTATVPARRARVGGTALVTGTPMHADASAWERGW